MNRFVVNRIKSAEENPFDRQERISWWNQDKLRKAKVMVVGAGALGNETLKNLALLGIGNIFIADFDEVSTSNLSRSILFRPTDEGQRKAKVAAERTKSLCLSDDVKIDWFHGDVVWELGTGAFREMDVVLGCLDNVETRFAINRQCWLANTPWIDAGIYELAGHVSVFIPPKPPCYQCAATKQQVMASRKRYSCDDFKRKLLAENKMPTVQVTSAMISAIQTQEAIKLLHDQNPSVGSKIFFQGTTNDYDVLKITANEHCNGHTAYPEIISLPLGNSTRLADFLAYVSRDSHSGVGAVLDFRSDRSFVESVLCRSCGGFIKMNRPSFRIYDQETVCSDCNGDGKVPEGTQNSLSTKNTISEFCLKKTSNEILDMRLTDLGVPLFHVVSVRDRNGNYSYYELTGDKTILMPRLFSANM